MRLVAVMIGGSAGALARWAVELAVPSVAGFPSATFLINVTGAFGLGLIGVLLLGRLPPTRYLRPLLGIGFLGAYTTFSTFTFETLRLLEDGAWRYAALNLLLSGRSASAVPWWPSSPPAEHEHRQPARPGALRCMHPCSRIGGWQTGSGVRLSSRVVPAAGVPWTGSRGSSTTASCSSSAPSPSSPTRRPCSARPATRCRRRSSTPSASPPPAWPRPRSGCTPSTSATWPSPASRRWCTAGSCCGSLPAQRCSCSRSRSPSPSRSSPSTCVAPRPVQRPGVAAPGTPEPDPTTDERDDHPG
jgi:CrcB protein